MISRALQLPVRQSFLLLGPRLTGKSTLLRHELEGKRVFTVDLLRASQYRRYLRDPGLLRQEVLDALRSGPLDWVFIDEIQRVPELLHEVQSMIEELGLCFALTGSSARKLKRGGANLLAGRALDLRLFPLISRELGQDFRIEEAMVTGLLPKIVSESSAVARVRILRAYVNLYLKEEIQAEQVVRSLGPFSHFLDLAAEANGQEINFSSISREVGVSSPSIRAYYQVLEDTLLGQFLLPWEKAVRKQLAGHPKFYFFDAGVVNALCERLPGKMDPVVLGGLFETVIVNEVRAQISYRELPLRLNYWKTSSGTEVDLVVSRGGRIRLAVELKNKVAPQPRDLSSLESLHDDHPEAIRILVSRVERGRSIRGVRVLPVETFLKELPSILEKL